MPQRTHTSSAVSTLRSTRLPSISLAMVSLSFSVSTVLFMFPLQYAATSEKQADKDAFIKEINKMFNFAEWRVSQGYAGDQPRTQVRSSGLIADTAPDARNSVTSAREK